MDKMRELFESKYGIPEMIFHVGGMGFDEYAVSDQCSIEQYESLIYQCSYLNDSYRAFKRGYEAANASQWISAENESLLPDFDVNVQVWISECGIDRQTTARRSKTNSLGDWCWYESNMTNTMLTAVTHHKPTVRPEGPTE